MARKETKSNRWIKSERVGNVMLFLTARSPFWWMRWQEDCEDESRVPMNGNGGDHWRMKTTKETDIGLARLIAGKKNEELFARRHFPDAIPPAQRQDPIGQVVEEFLAYLRSLHRSNEYIRNIRSRLLWLTTWMQARGLSLVQEVTPAVLSGFMSEQAKRGVKATTVNHYLDAAHCLFGFVICKRKLMLGPNPAATGRQAELDRLQARGTPPPTIYPGQINAIIQMANRHADQQVVEMIVFICEGGFRFQELQFLQVGDINLEGREIILDVKRPDPKRVRPEMQKRCLTPDGLWIPKTRAGRRPIHITDRLARTIEAMGLGGPADWVFKNRAGRQVAENKSLQRLKRYALEADVLVEEHPKSGKPWSLIRWHWLRHYHRTRAHVSKIRREVSKIAMGHAADSVHDHYRGLDTFAFHEEYAKFDSGIDDILLIQNQTTESSTTQ